MDVVRAQQLCDALSVLRVQMLHEHEAQTRVQREGLEAAAEGLQPSGGRADGTGPGSGECWALSAERWVLVLSFEF